MLVNFTLMGGAGVINGDDQRGARNQLSCEAGQDRAVRLICQNLVVTAATTDDPADIACVPGVLFALQMSRKSLLHAVVPQFRRAPYQIAFDQPAGIEDFSGFLHGGAGDKCTAIGNKLDNVIRRQPRQNRPDPSTPDSEQVAKFILFQMGSRQQLVVDDRIEDLPVNGVIVVRASSHPCTTV